MIRKYIRALVIILSLFHGSEGADAAALPSPNVLFIIADDLNTDLGCYGDPIVKSPNIDRLAAGAVRFDRAYCQYPVCNPSRTSFLSGRRPENTRVLDNLTPTRSHLKDTVMLPEHFRRQGYQTLKVGKIFHTGNDFEDSRSWDEDVRETKEAKNPPKEQRAEYPGNNAGIVLNAPDEKTWDGRVGRQAVAFMEKAASREKPFFLATGFRRPHAPYIAPSRYFDLYPTANMRWPNEPAAHLRDIPVVALTFPPGKPALPEKRRGEVMAAYFSSISFMDAQVGVVLEALDRLKLRDRTIVVLIGDHGYHLGEHGGFWHKMSLFEESVRVPLIVAAPGRKPGVATGLVELLDLFPTLVDLCGLPAPAGLEGRSFAPLLDKPGQAWKPAVFSVVLRGELSDPTNDLNPAHIGRSVRTERWRYTEWWDGSTQLYDHNNDPREYVNLAGNPAHAATVSELRSRIASVVSGTGKGSAGK